MAINKVFMNEENKATFVCPECERAKTVDVSKYKDIKRAVRVKAKCKCGNQYSVLLERRKYYRKETKLPGYVYGESDNKGPMTVKDLSRFGIKFELGSKRFLFVGDKVVVEFELDDGHKTLIKKEVKIVSLSGNLIGAEFCNMGNVDLADRRLGFYLMP